MLLHRDLTVTLQMGGISGPSELDFIFLGHCDDVSSGVPPIFRRVVRGKARCFMDTFKLCSCQSGDRS